VIFDVDGRGTDQGLILFLADLLVLSPHRLNWRQVCRAGDADLGGESQRITDQLHTIVMNWVDGSHRRLRHGASGSA
jgi:hypothetical protein